MALIEFPTCHVLQLRAPLLRNARGQQGARLLSLSLCVRVSTCFSCVSIDARHVESGDGAVAWRYASCWGSVHVLPQEASKSGLG